MAPRAKRGEAASPQAFHQLGVRGRKTGVFLRDGGERDEHGMQPLDDLLSSPRKARAPSNQDDDDEEEDEDDSGSEDMDIASSAGPGPRTLLKNQRNLQFPIPRSRSPLKTSLNSPARKNPHLDRVSSPLRGSGGEDRDPTVTRRLDFAARGDRSMSGGGGARRTKMNGVNGAAHDDIEELESEVDAVIGGHAESDGMDMLLEQSLQLVEDMRESGSEEEEEEDDEPVVRQPAVSAKKGRGRPAKKAVAPLTQPEELSDPEPPTQDDGEPVKRRRGRPAKKDQPQGKSPRTKSPQTKTGSTKRRSLRNSTGDGDDDDSHLQEEREEDPREAKRRRKEEAAASSAAAAKAKATAAAKTSKKRAAVTQPESESKAKKPRGRPGRKAKEPDAGGAGDSGEAGEASFVALQRGPPMPKSRGLMSVHRDADSLKQTRSGRHSYRPLDYWRGEQTIKEEEELDDMFYDGHFVVPALKEVVRVPKDAPPSKRAPGSKTRTKAKSKLHQAVEEDEELEEWEMNPGTVTGEIVLWEPEHEQHPPADDEPVQVTDERVAISADAVQTTDIRDATFRFAKTLTMPFMGAGIVDLPPGAEKRPKNSRKMHMVFFVHYGKVVVTINEAQFRISAGGTWFVPRGNYYSITNDYETPSRVFFAQACEISAPTEDMTQQSMLG